MLACAAPLWAAHKPPSARPGARFVELKALPATLELDNARDARRVIVSARTPDGFWMDVTENASFRPAAPLVTRDADGLFHPARAGTTALTITAQGLTTRVPVHVKSVASPPVSFVREVMPILSRTGCNAGTCHGSAKGKNGFKLSLRGYDAEYDYHALVDDLAGRRFNRAQPSESLMLLKPTQGAAHQGGLVFEPGSRYYSMLYRWIAEGVRSDVPKVARANRLEVLPDAPKMVLPGQKQQLIVLAHYPDGTVRDVTRDAVFSTTMKEVATVTPDGMVEAARRGESAILVRYEGNYAADGITVLGDRTGYAWKPQPEYNYIDRLVDAKLRKIKALPSGLCTDAEFVRRVYLDIAGMPPTPEQVRAFLADTTPTREKRAKLVDRLLDSPDYANNWTNKWADLLDCNRKYLGDRGVWKFRNWIYDQVATNRPYNQFVRDIVTAEGSTYEHPAASYYRVIRDPNIATENVTQLFLGIRFNCNKCHDHPFERWTQTQYYHFAANFARVTYKPGLTEGDEDVFEQRSGEVINPRTNTVATADFPYTFQAKLPHETDRRAALADWLTAPENSYFAKSMANRVWSYFLGKGIIDPVDDIRAGNPPSNPELLDALTQDFIHGGFDVKRLIRTICDSRVYQSSIRPNKWNSDDTANFSHAIPRRLTAEQLADAINRATGTVQRYPGVPVGYRACQLPDSSVAAGGFLDLFGRPPRQSPCECERSSTVSLGQALSLINSPVTNDTVSDPDGRVARLLKTHPDDRKIVEELYLAAWCRPPSETEVKKTLPFLQVSDGRVKDVLNARADKGDIDITPAEARTQLKTEAAQDLLWGLLNSPAFLFNR